MIISVFFRHSIDSCFWDNGWWSLGSLSISFNSWFLINSTYSETCKSFVFGSTDNVLFVVSILFIVIVGAIVVVTRSWLICCSPCVHLILSTEKDKLLKYIASCSKESLKRTEYHSIYNNFTTFKMRSTAVTIALSIISEYKL